MILIGVFIELCQQVFNEIFLEVLAILLLYTIEFCVLGTLAPSLKPSKLNDTIDLIFATHWIYPSQTPVLQADDEKCVNDELSKRSGKYINLYIYCP